MSTTQISSFLDSEGCHVSDSSEKSIRTRHQVGTQVFEIVGVLNDGFPRILPEYFLCNRESFRRLAHVGWPRKLHIESDVSLEDVGLICTGSSDSLALNYHCPEKVYLAGLKKAVAAFGQGLGDSTWNDEECLREFAGHWQFAASETPIPIVLFGESSGFITELLCSRPKTGETASNPKPIALAKDLDSHSKTYWPRRQGEERERDKSGKGLLVKLSKLPLPPEPGESLAEWWNNCLLIQPPVDQIVFRERARHCRAKEFWIICQTHFEDQDVWFCLIAKTIDKTKAPLAKDFLQDWKFEARLVEPHTKGYLIPRGGGASELQKKSVLLVGCGSVGSIVANSLASSGIGKLALADDDFFCLDNLYRHSLSMLWDLHPKCEAIAASMRCKYPFTVFEPYRTKLLDFSEEALASFDLIVVAIGNSTHEFAFNEKMVTNKIGTAVVYTWLEPNSFGGHAVLVGGSFEAGCQQCNFLIPGGEGERMLTPNLNFLKADQMVTKRLGSCGSRFLPYSEMDAAQTANMATRFAINFLLGKSELGKKISWKGDFDPEDFPNLLFSDRCYQFHNQLKEIPVKNPLCRLCI